MSSMLVTAVVAVVRVAVDEEVDDEAGRHLCF